MILKTTMESPVGKLHAFACEGTLVGLLFSSSEKSHLEKQSKVGTLDCDPVFGALDQQLREYFVGTRKEFTLPLNPTGTEFQRAAWTALQTIPYGATRSYGQQAAAIGRPKAVRAVGAANGQNPISIVIPCHRVIGADGKLTGFGGGLETKRYLLDHEARNSHALMF